jgi:hypothetical protein
MTAGLRFSAGTKNGFDRIAEAWDNGGDFENGPGRNNDAFCCKILLIALFGVIVALKVAGETNIELLFHMPMSMRITADAARK